jgi:hypothetical protein
VACIPPPSLQSMQIPTVQETTRTAPFHWIYPSPLPVQVAAIAPCPSARTAGSTSPPGPKDSGSTGPPGSPPRRVAAPGPRRPTRPTPVGSVRLLHGRVEKAGEERERDREGGSCWTGVADLLQPHTIFVLMPTLTRFQQQPPSYLASTGAPHPMRHRQTRAAAAAAAVDASGPAAAAEFRL